MSRGICLPGLLLLAACAPATGDSLVDRVARKVDPFADCLVVGQTVMELAAVTTRPAALTPEAFADPQVRRAAEALVEIPHAVPSRRPLRHFGRCGAPDEAPVWHTSIGRLVINGTYAFVHYTAADGSIGAFAFRREAIGWTEAEHVRLGQW